MQRMDRLRRSLRESFRRKKDGPESSKPHQWQADEEAVRAGNCTFHVKYLGCVEVFESRGMQVCEEAMKVLRGSRRRPVKANLYVTGDGLRVVEDDTKGLIVDQTIEKVSFCAPDRNHERGFSYICRDGTTRRWMCHGFLSTKDSGERLSHAVGCAFAVCLERKQKREKECGVTMTYDSKTSTFTRSGSFRVTSMTDSLNSKTNTASSPEGPMNVNVNNAAAAAAAAARTPAVPTHAIERPHAPPKMLERQGSFRGFSQLSNHSPFKRQLSLRLNELPSNLLRTQNIFGTNVAANSIPPVSASPAPPPRTQRNRLHSLPTGSFAGGTIPEVSSSNTSSELNLGSPTKVENKDLVSELCQQVSQGLSLLAANHDENTNRTNRNNSSAASKKFPTKFTNPWDEEVGSNKNGPLPIFNTTALETANSVIPTGVSSNISSSTLNSLSSSKSSTSNKPVDSWINNLTQSHGPKAPLQPKISPIKENIPVKSTPNNISSIIISKTPNASNRNIIDTTTTPSSGTVSIVSTNDITNHHQISDAVNSKSIASNNLMNRPSNPQRGAPSRSQSLGSDPFDADWATPLALTGQTPTNPFARQQTFQVSM